MLNFMRRDMPRPYYPPPLDYRSFFQPACAQATVADITFALTGISTPADVQRDFAAIPKPIITNSALVDPQEAFKSKMEYFSQTLAVTREHFKQCMAPYAPKFVATPKVFQAPTPLIPAPRVSSVTIEVEEELEESIHEPVLDSHLQVEEDLKSAMEPILDSQDGPVAPESPSHPQVEEELGAVVEAVVEDRQDERVATKSPSFPYVIDQSLRIPAADAPPVIDLTEETDEDSDPDSVPRPAADLTGWKELTTQEAKVDNVPVPDVNVPDEDMVPVAPEPEVQTPEHPSEQCIDQRLTRGQLSKKRAWETVQTRARAKSTDPPTRCRRGDCTSQLPALKNVLQYCQQCYKAKNLRDAESRRLRTKRMKMRDRETSRREAYPSTSLQNPLFLLYSRAAYTSRNRADPQTGEKCTRRGCTSNLPALKNTRRYCRVCTHARCRRDAEKRKLRSIKKPAPH